MKNLLVVSIYNDVFRFFERMIPALKELGYSPVFLTNKHSIILECRKKSLKFLPIKKSPGQLKDDLPVHLEGTSGTLTNAQAKALYSRTYGILENFHNSNNIDLMFIWSGIRLIDATAKQFAERHNIKSVVFEIGNFPGKVFADPQGTNAQSLLAENPDILSSFSYNKEEFESWRKKYYETNSKQLAVPQSSNVASIDYSKNLKDLYGFKTKGLLKFEPVLTYKKLMNKMRRKYSGFDYDSVNIEKDRYIFYPMQVSDDAQLLIHSPIENIEALKLTAKEAADKGLQLFVKPHPAERDFEYIEKIEQLKKDLNFKFVNDNTLQLIHNSELVVTINSTVGLQSLILQKSFKTLAKAYYTNFTQEHLGKYIQSYLVNIDFWGSELVTVDLVSKLISRSEIPAV